MLTLLNHLVKYLAIIIFGLSLASFTYAEADRDEDISIVDINADGVVDSRSDGLLLLRSMFGLTGDALANGLPVSDAAHHNSVGIESRIASLVDLADVDGNGNVDALTDGLLMLRYLSGLKGGSLISKVVATDATRTTAIDIEAHLTTLMPALSLGN